MKVLTDLKGVHVKQNVWEETTITQRHLFYTASALLISIGTMCTLTGYTEVGGLLLAAWVIMSGFYRRELGNGLQKNDKRGIDFKD